MFSFLNKKAKSPIDERNFLKITWDKDYNDTLPVVQDILETVDQERDSYLGNNTKSQSIFDTLPYLSFLEADILLSEIKESFVYQKGENFIIEKLEVVYRDSKGAISTDGELYISPLIVDDDFHSLIDLLVETMFNDSNFSKYSYQSKCYYFTGNSNSDNKEAQRGLFDEYLKSTSFNDNVIPLLPTEEEAELGNYTVNTNKVTGNESDNISIQEQKSDEQYEHEDELGTVDLVPPAVSNRYGTENTESLSIVPPIFNQVVKEDRESETSTIISSHGDSNVVDEVSQVHVLKFPEFEVLNDDMPKIEKYNPTWVDSEINRLKKSFNSKIKEQEKQANKILTQLVNQRVQKEVNQKKKEINDWLSQNDIRDNLKQEIIAENIALKDERIKQEIDELGIRKNNLIDEENKRHQQRLAEIELAFSTEKKGLDKKLTAEFLDITNRQYEERYLIQTQKLQKHVKDQLDIINKIKPELQDKYFNELSTDFYNLGQYLFQNYQESLEKFIPYFKQEHLSAEWQYNMKREEEIQKQKLDDSKREMQQVTDELQNIKTIMTNQEKVVENVNNKPTEDSELIKVVELFTEAIKEKEIPKIQNSSENNSTSKFRKMSAGLLCLFVLGGTAANTIINGENSKKAVEQTKLSMDKQQEFSTALTNSQIKVVEQLDLINKSQQEIANKPVYKLPIVEGGTPIAGNSFLTGSVDK